MSREIAIRSEVGPPQPVAFALLGAFRLRVGGRAESPGPEQVQRLLVKLLAAKAAPIANDELLQAIWDEVPGPAATAESLHHLVGVARRRLASVGLPDVLVNGRGNYRLDVPPALVDVHQFHALTARARELAREYDPRAVKLLDEALGLRRGEPLAGLRGDWVNRYRLTLEGELLAAEQALCETAIQHDQAGDRLPRLSSLYRERPDDERLTWLLMHALYRTGRRAEALTVKLEFGARLSDAFGLDCGKAIDDLYLRILNNDESLLAPGAVNFPPGQPGARPRTPRHPDQPAERQEQEAGAGQAQAGQAQAGQPDTIAGDEAAGSELDIPAPTVSNVFHGAVDVRKGVIGVQVVQGRRR